MSTLDLFAWPAAPGAKAETPRAKPSRPSIDQRFAEFHAKNPHVLDELRRLALARVGRGEARISIKALWEELRVSLETIHDGGLGGLDGPPYKLDNSFTALYSRLLIRCEPQLARVIETRKRRGE